MVVRAELQGVMSFDRSPQPSGVDGDDDDEQRQGQEEMDGAQDVDDLGLWATVEVVDVEHDALERWEVRRAALHPLPPGSG